PTPGADTRVRDSPPFAPRAGEHGHGATATGGGDLACFQRGMMVAPFEEAVAAAEVGEVAGPAESQFGFHAVLVYERQPASVRPFEEVGEAVAESIANDTANATMQGLFRGSGLVTYPERLEGL